MTTPPPHIDCQWHNTPGQRHAVVTLCHAGKHNAITRSMWRDLAALFEQLQQQALAADPLRCVVVRGADGHFSSGGDIAQYPSFRFDAQQLQAFHEQDIWGALHAMLACDATLVAAIEGSCMGGGLEIAACCDIRLAIADSRFGAPIGRLGFAMAPREAALLVQRLGWSHVQSMLLEAAIYTATDLHPSGFITRCVPDTTALVHELNHTRTRILQLAPSASQQTKRLLRQWQYGQFQQMQQMQHIQQPTPQPVDNSTHHTAWAHEYAALAAHPHHREGITAFLAKRPPRFMPVQATTPAPTMPPIMH